MALLLLSNFFSWYKITCK